jgi:hypothetical protein
MRLIAIAAGHVEGFSFGAFTELVALGVLVGAPAALAYDAVRARLPRRGWTTGALLGVLMFAVPAIRPPPAARSAMAATDDPPLLTAGLFLAMFVLFGLAVETWARRRGNARSGLSSGPTPSHPIDQHLPAEHNRQRA